MNEMSTFGGLPQRESGAESFCKQKREHGSGAVGVKIKSNFNRQAPLIANGLKNPTEVFFGKRIRVVPRLSSLGWGDFFIFCVPKLVFNKSFLLYTQ